MMGNVRQEKCCVEEQFGVGGSLGPGQAGAGVSNEQESRWQAAAKEFRTS
jgi:hypothetical protein